MKTINIITPEELNPDDFELIDGKWRVKIPPSPINLFNSFGFLSNEVNIWTGVVEAVNGVWTVDYSSAGFSSPPIVIPVAHTSGSGEDGGNYASIKQTSITTTGCSGRAHNAITTGLLVATANIPANTKVTVIAIGIPK